MEVNLKTLAVTISSLGILGGAALWVNNQLTEWKNVPTRLSAIETLLENDRGISYDAIDVLGGDIAVITPTVNAGEDVWIAFRAKANIDCERSIEVRFYNEDNRAFYFETRVDPAVRSAVADEYQFLSIPIRTFEDMPSGRYRYAPSVLPIKCGVYRRQYLPFSDSFKVIGNEDAAELFIDN